VWTRALAESDSDQLAGVWAAQREWQDVPGVRVVGAVLGILLIMAAIRAMFGRRK
jgi:hypothetical protein